MRNDGHIYCVSWIYWFYSLIFFSAIFIWWFFATFLFFSFGQFLYNPFFQIRYRDVIESKFIFSKSQLSIVFVKQVLCIHNEYVKQKHKSIRKVLRINAQKLLYALTFFATAIKGIYFFTKVSWCFFSEKGLTLGIPMLILEFVSWSQQTSY